MTSVEARSPNLLQKVAFWQVRKLGRDGDAARDLRDWRAAIANYQAYLTLRPNRWPIRVQLGHAFKETGDFLAAEAAYRSAAEAAPGDADVHLQLARALVLSGKLDAARDAYQKSFELDPDGPAKGELENFDRERSVLSNTGHALHITGATRVPDWRSLADARAARDQRAWDSASAEYRSYLATDPKSAAGWEELAGVLQAAERYSEALEAVQRALGLRTPTVTTLTLKATSLRALGRVEASMEAWMEVARMSGAKSLTDDFGQPLPRPKQHPHAG